MADERIITKYDYLRYFTRISKFWFHSNQEIELYIQGALQDEVESEDNEEEFEPEFEMYDFDDLNKKGKDQKTTQMIEGNLIEDRFVQFIQEQFPRLRLVDLRKYYLLEELVKKTQLAIAEGDCIILQATFHSEQRNAVCKSDFLIVDDKEITLVEVKGTTTVKRKHFLDVFYQYKIATDAGFKIDNVMMGLIRYEKLKRGQISFVLTDNCQLSKENSAKSKEKYLDEHAGDETKAGQARRLAELSPTRFNLLQGILQKAECPAESPKSVKSWNQFWDSFWKKHDFDAVLKRLRKHEYVTLEGALVPDDLDYPELLGSEFYEYAPEVRAIVATKDRRYQYSGMIPSLRWKRVKANHELDLFHLVEEEKNEMVQAMVQTGTDSIEKKALFTKLAELNEKMVFFDFESINPAVRAADETFPFQQVVTQCSVICSDQLNQRKNLIIDPQKISRHWWQQVVDSIYRDGEWSYVVYNKTFECSRLNEIKKMLNQAERSSKIDQITTRVFDLADIFDIRKKITVLAALKGYYSIKKVLPLAMGKIKEPLSSPYDELSVQKGTDAMELTMKRHFEQMGDSEWQAATKVLCQYCENDVLAMIDVLTFARQLVS